MIKRLATVAVYVESQAEAEKFWIEEVEFEVKRKEQMGPSASWLEVGPEGGSTNLVIYPRAMMKNWEQMKPSVVFETDDFELTYGKMKRNGVLFIDEPKEMAWGTYATFVDEDGNEFLLKG